MELFTEILPETKQTLNTALKITHLPKHSIINNKSINNFFYYVMEGWLKLYDTTVDGNEVVIDILAKNSFFGENRVILAKNDNVCAQAITDSTLIMIPINTLSLLIKNDHRLALNMLKFISHKNVILSKELEHFTIQNAMQRISSFILKLSVENQLNGNIKIPLEKALVASKLGMRAETFSRALVKLCKVCDIKIDGLNIEISQLKKLSDFVCNNSCSVKSPCAIH